MKEREEGRDIKIYMTQDLSSRNLGKRSHICTQQENSEECVGSQEKYKLRLTAAIKSYIAKYRKDVDG